MAAATAADIGHAAAEAAKAASENINSETRIARRSVENKDRENIYYMHIYSIYHMVLVWLWHAYICSISNNTNVFHLHKSLAIYMAH